MLCVRQPKECTSHMHLAILVSYLMSFNVRKALVTPQKVAIVLLLLFYSACHLNQTSKSYLRKMHQQRTA